MIICHEDTHIMWKLKLWEGNKENETKKEMKKGDKGKSLEDFWKNLHDTLLINRTKPPQSQGLKSKKNFSYLNFLPRLSV